MEKPSPRILIGITGASGSIYAERLLQVLTEQLPRVYLIVTASGRQVVAHELRKNTREFSLRKILADNKHPCVRIFANDDFFAPVASGSNVPDAAVVIPCSMGTLSRVSHGFSTTLLERVCDVVLKQKKQLIMVPRETPLNTLHLNNMLRLAAAGAQLVPASPAFYHKPRTMADLIDFVVSRVLDCLDFPHNISHRWNSRML